MLGTATFYLDGAQSLNFAMPAAYLTRMMMNPERFDLTSLRETEEIERTAPETSISMSSIKLDFRGLPNKFDFRASIVNRSNHDIRNVKILVQYFNDCASPGCEIPVHHHYFLFKVTIPANLSLQVEKLRVSGSRYWVPEAQILDYEIIPNSSGISTIVFE